MKQNTAIITGASEGIGAALTKLLIQHEWNVIGLSRNLEKLKLLQNNLCDNKDYLSIYACDVQDFSKLKSITKELSFTELLDTYPKLLKGEYFGRAIVNPNK